MAVLAGIDEAGYGPMLGPLVVSGAAFRVDEHRLDECLWATLRESCTGSVRRGERRLAIADSKKLHNTRNGMTLLERAALVMLAVAGQRPKSWIDLLNSLSPGAASSLEAYPWYRDVNPALPLSSGVGDISTRANSVRLDAAAQGVELIGIVSEPLLEGHFNNLVENTRNKAVVLLDMAMRCVDRILRTYPDERVRVCVDRLGGRRRYRESLNLALPTWDLQILEESETRSAYRLTRGLDVCNIEFVTRGETHHLPIALASIYSKYLRELHMHVFNGYWEGKQAGLRPTAGYYTDASRWLKDVSPTLDRLRVDRGMLLRLR